MRCSQFTQGGRASSLAPGHRKIVSLPFARRSIKRSGARPFAIDMLRQSEEIHKANVAGTKIMEGMLVKRIHPQRLRRVNPSQLKVKV